jgi:hypothetical protein
MAGSGPGAGWEPECQWAWSRSESPLALAAQVVGLVPVAARSAWQLGLGPEKAPPAPPRRSANFNASAKSAAGGPGPGSRL